MLLAEPATAPAVDSAQRVVVLGDVLDDIIVATEREPSRGTDTEARIQHRAGGCAANTAAWLGSLGVDVHFVGRVGVGDVQRHSQLLANAGVSPRLAYAPSEHTGTVVITVDGSTRTMLTDRGASAGLDLDTVTSDVVTGASVVHVTGYSIVDAASPAEYRRLVARIRRAGARISVDPASSGFIADYGPEAFLDLVDGSDLFFPSFDEGRLLSGEDDPPAIVGRLSRRFGLVAMMLPDGSAIAGRRGARTVRSPRVATKLVDPIGAGDAFTAGFLGSWLESSGMAVSARHGLKLSAEALAVVGGRPPR